MKNLDFDQIKMVALNVGLVVLGINAIVRHRAKVARGEIEPLTQTPMPYPLAVQIAMAAFMGLLSLAFVTFAVRVVIEGDWPEGVTFVPLPVATTFLTVLIVRRMRATGEADPA